MVALERADAQGGWHTMTAPNGEVRERASGVKYSKTPPASEGRTDQRRGKDPSMRNITD